MKSQFLLLCICVQLAISSATAQDSVLVQPQPGQSAPGNQSSQSEQKEDRVEVDKQMLPPMLKEALTEEKYAGWENSPIYYEKNTDQYLLHITKDNSTQTFRFDKKGQPITTDKPAETEEKRQ